MTLNWVLSNLCRQNGRAFVAMLCAFLALSMNFALAVSPATAQVIWEDYQGTNGILGTSNQDKPGPSYNNNSATAAINLDLLRTISADIANSTRTGTSATIDYNQASGTLCDLAVVDPAGTSSACQADAQGRVLYALVKFPTTGTYTFSAAHDDEVDMDLSSDYSNTNYKSAAYNLPVGNVGSYTANDTTYENLAGVFSSPTANACILLRLYWNNAGGINFLRLRWTTPSGATQIVPASQLFNPGLAASSAGCSGSITGAGVSAVVNKVIGSTGRAGAADQFAVALKNNGGTIILASATTSGAGTGQQASTGAAIVAVSTTYQVTDAMAAGSTNTLTAAYAPTLACTRNGTAFTPGGAAPTWTITTTNATSQQIICNITNTRRTASLLLRKAWVNAQVNDAVTIPATTGFSSNTTALNTVANTANETDAGTASTVSVGDNGILTAENFTAGTATNYTSTLTCSAGTLSGTNAQAANTLLIPVASAGTTITCTYTNSFITRLSAVKTSSVVNDGISVTNPKALPQSIISYCILITNTGTQNATSVISSDTLPSDLTYITGSLRTGTSCAGATTVEDENSSGADETDPFGMSFAGTTVTGTAATLAPAESFALVFNATVN
jgi:uncharacterized repeat protein (TIGR01451 family)